MTYKFIILTTFSLITISSYSVPDKQILDNTARYRIWLIIQEQKYKTQLNILHHESISSRSQNGKELAKTCLELSQQIHTQHMALFRKLPGEGHEFKNGLYYLIMENPDEMLQFLEAFDKSMPPNTPTNSLSDLESALNIAATLKKNSSNMFRT